MSKEDEYGQLKIIQIKELLKNANASVYGKKEELVTSTEKSPAWAYFVEFEGNKARCLKCSSIVNSSGNTSNLHAHLVRQHSIVLPKAVKRKLGESSNESDKKFADSNDTEHPALKQPKLDSAMARLTAYQKDKYFYLAEKLKKTFAKIEGLSMTTDIWTDTINTKSYLGLTAYYIEENDIKTAILGVHELDSNHTSDNVQLWILEMLNEWDLPTTKILAVIADGAANIKSALTTIFGGSKEQVTSIQCSIKSAPPSAEEFEILQEMVFVLEPFQTATKIVSGAKYVTGS
ncbi:hypothetical protein TKK_0002230 [Trichogramma kaykai]